MGIMQIPSPNHDSRNGHEIDMIVLHVTDSPNVAGALSWFTKPESQVSAHFVIGKDGNIYQCVIEDDAAWHCRGVNDRSIGIEFEGMSADQCGLQQALSGVMLLNALCERYALTLANITGHKWAVETDKSCPGKLFGDTLDDLKAFWKLRLSPEFTM
jgi:N-acetyl-anhydromuramyl-L-alanine amidase AmpD